MANFFTNLFETTGRGIGSFDPLVLFQRAMGHREASQRTRDFISDPIALMLRRGGHLQGAEDWQKGGGIAQLIAALIVGGAFAGGAFGGAGGAGGSGGAGAAGFSPGSAAAQEGMGLGGLFGQGMEGGATGGGGLGFLGKMGDYSSLLGNLPSDGGGGGNMGARAGTQMNFPESDPARAREMLAMALRLTQPQPMSGLLGQDILQQLTQQLTRRRFA